jgi:hypothetical protein
MFIPSPSKPLNCLAATLPETAHHSAAAAGHAGTAPALVVKALNTLKR